MAVPVSCLAKNKRFRRVIKYNHRYDGNKSYAILFGKECQNKKEHPFNDNPFPPFIYPFQEAVKGDQAKKEAEQGFAVLEAGYHFGMDRVCCKQQNNSQQVKDMCLIKNFPEDF